MNNSIIKCLALAGLLGGGYAAVAAASKPRYTVIATPGRWTLAAESRTGELELYVVPASLLAEGPARFKMPDGTELRLEASGGRLTIRENP